MASASNSNAKVPRGSPARLWDIVGRRVGRAPRHAGPRPSSRRAPRPPSPRPRHIVRGSGETAVAQFGICEHDGQRATIGHRDTGLGCEPRCEQVGFGDRHRRRVSGQARQHDGRLCRSGILVAVNRLSPVSSRLRHNSASKESGKAAPAESGLERPRPKIVDELLQIVHRTPNPRATTPRNTSLVPPRRVNSGECSRAVANSSASRSASGVRRIDAVQQIGDQLDGVLFEACAEILHQRRPGRRVFAARKRAGHRDRQLTQAKSSGRQVHPPRRRSRRRHRPAVPGWRRRSR